MLFIVGECLIMKAGDSWNQACTVGMLLLQGLTAHAAHELQRDIQTQHSQVTYTLTCVRASTLFYATDQRAHRTRMYSLRCLHAGPYLAQGPTLTQPRYPPTSACPTQTLFAMVNFVWGPQASPPGSQPRAVTVVNTRKVATWIMP